jgi:CHAT domain-containing protein
LTKVEALRDAQLDLLRGKITPQSGGSDRGFSMPADDRAAALNYAHPYYWAPFVLMGNWR